MRYRSALQNVFLVGLKSRPHVHHCYYSTPGSTAVNNENPELWYSRSPKNFLTVLEPYRPENATKIVVELLRFQQHETIAIDFPMSSMCSASHGGVSILCSELSPIHTLTWLTLVNFVMYHHWARSSSHVLNVKSFYLYTQKVQKRGLNSSMPNACCNDILGMRLSLCAHYDLLIGVSTSTSVRTNLTTSKWLSIHKCNRNWLVI